MSTSGSKFVFNANTEPWVPVLTPQTENQRLQAENQRLRAEIKSHQIKIAELKNVTTPGEIEDMLTELHVWARGVYDILDLDGEISPKEVQEQIERAVDEYEDMCM